MPLASHPAAHLACTELCCPGLPLTATTCCRCLCPQPFGSKPLATNVYVRSPSGRCPGSPASTRKRPAPAAYAYAPLPGLAAPLLLATDVYARSPSGLSRLFPAARRSCDRNYFYAIFYAPPDFGTAFALTLKRNFFHLIWLVSIELPAVVRQPVFFFFPALVRKCWGRASRGR